MKKQPLITWGEPYSMCPNEKRRRGWQREKPQKSSCENRIRDQSHAPASLWLLRATRSQKRQGRSPSKLKGTVTWQTYLFSAADSASEQTCQRKWKKHILERNQHQLQVCSIPWRYGLRCSWLCGPMLLISDCWLPALWGDAFPWFVATSLQPLSPMVTPPIPVCMANSFSVSFL